MYNIYEVRYYNRIDHGTWIENYSSVGDNHYRLILSDEEIIVGEEWQNLSWDMFNSALKHHPLSGIARRKTLITKRPYIRIYDVRGEYYNNYFYSDEHTFSIKVEYTKINPSVKWLTEHLTADEFIKYFKSRGMTVCPIT